MSFLDNIQFYLNTLKIYILTDVFTWLTNWQSWIIISAIFVTICCVTFVLYYVYLLVFPPFWVITEHFIFLASQYTNYTLLTLNYCPRVWCIHLQWIQVHCQIIHLFTAHENTFIIMKYLTCLIAIISLKHKQPYAGTHTYKHI